MGVRILREIWAKRIFLPTREGSSKRRKLVGILVKDKSGDIAREMLSLYMHFNRNGIWDGETMCI